MLMITFLKLLNRPVAIEVPHFASLYSKTRQLAVLRSNDGETWKEHKAPCNEHVFNKQYASEGT